MKIRILFALMLCTLFALPLEAARFPGEEDHEVYTPNKKYKLVLMNPNPGNYYSEDEELRKTYKTSGLYKVEDDTLVWPTTAYFSKDDVFLSPDGKFFAGIPDWATAQHKDVDSQNVLSFYKEGQLLHTYTHKQLNTIPYKEPAPKSELDALFKNFGGTYVRDHFSNIAYNAEDNTLNFTYNKENVHKFDMRTGTAFDLVANMSSVIQNEQEKNSYTIYLIVGGLLAIFILALYVSRSKNTVTQA